jgi:hypothetical protein
MPDLIVALEEHGRKAAHEYMRAVTPFAVFLYMPVAAGYAALGFPPVHAILGDRLGAGTVDLFWDLSRIFLLMGVVWTVFVGATTIALSQRRYRQLATIGGGMLALHTLAVVLVSPAGSIAVGIVHSCTGSLIIALPLVVVFGRRAAIEAAGAAWVSLPAAALALVFPAAGLLGAGDTTAGALALLVAGAGVYVALGALLWPSVGRRSLALLLRRA